MAPLIPDRWLNYTPMGRRVEGTRFIAFKVPLREAVNQNVEEQQRLDASLLLKSIPNLGMIIDLTNTSRYYTPDCFVKKGLEYNKLMIPGHHTPAPNLVDQFKKMVVNFLKKNSDNDKLIGVHCTHGVNRTGYLICNYMISELDVKPEDAIDKFNHSRGHKIERENYLNSLHSLKKASAAANSAVNRPSASKREGKHPTEAAPSKEPISWRAPQKPKLPPAPKEFERRDRFERMKEAPRREPVSWRAPQEPILPPSPKVFDRRDRFERFRQEANMNRPRVPSAGNAATARPARQFLDSRFPNAQRHDRNYSSRYVNTGRNASQVGTPDNHRHEDNTYRRRYKLDNRLPPSSRERYQPYRRI